MFRTTLSAATAVITTLAFGAAFGAVPQMQPEKSRPMFQRGVGLHPNLKMPTKLPNWTFSYVYQGNKYSDIFIGTEPSTGGSTTIPVYLIPIKMVYGNTSFSPSALLPNGKTVTQNTLDSPVFQSSVDYVQGGTDIGKTQYIDAFQRANLWGTVSGHPGYHTLLATPTVEPLQTLIVPKSAGAVGRPFGTKVIGADINYFDAQAEQLLGKLHIPANALPIFLTTQTYLTSNGGCCIGGYHNYNGVGTYSHFTYIQHPGDFAQDVSALSHEISEWIDDPFVNNTSPCGGLYEVGDPLEREANYGAYPYVIKGFTYNLQDEATPVYFGAPLKTTVHGWKTFQGTKLLVCQNGQ